MNSRSKHQRQRSGFGNAGDRVKAKVPLEKECAVGCDLNEGDDWDEELPSRIDLMPALPLNLISVILVKLMFTLITKPKQK